MQAQPTTTALIYPRISQPGQSAYSISTQIEAARRLAAERGYAIAGVYPDEHSGEELDRPGLRALLDAIPRTGATVVLIHDIDRMGRDRYVQAVTERLIEDAGARIQYVLTDYTGESGELLKDFKGAIAAYENRQRVERSRRGKNGKAAAGQVIIPASRAPYGYDYVAPGKGQGQLVIREDQAASVRQVFAWLAVHQLSTNEIARRLHAAGVPSKGDLSASVRKKAGRATWTPGAVRLLLSNPVYAGTWYWGKVRSTRINGRKVKVAQPESEWTAVPVPAIVPRETWDAAQRQRQINAKRTYHETARHYLLRGMIVCPCGRRWVGRNQQERRTASYRCPTTTGEPWRPACTWRFGIPQSAIEQAVWRYVFGELLHPANLRAELERQQSAAAAAAKERARTLRAIDGALRDLDRKLSILVGEALDGIPAQIIDARKRALLAERRDLEEARERTQILAEQHDITPATIATIEDLAARVQQAEPDFTPEERRRILTLLRVRVDVLDRERVRVTGLVSEAVLATPSPCRACGGRRRTGRR